MNKFKCAVEVICPNINKPSKACLHCPSPAASGKVRTKDTCTTNRPLTDDEFKSMLKLIEDNELDIIHNLDAECYLLDLVKRGNVKVKGSQVILIPQEATDGTG